MAVHKALCTNVNTELEGYLLSAGLSSQPELEGEHHLGDILPRNSLLFFLESCLEIIPTADAHEDVILRAVKALLPHCQRYSNNCPRTSLQKAVDSGRHHRSQSRPRTSEPPS